VRLSSRFQAGAEPSDDSLPSLEFDRPYRPLFSSNSDRESDLPELERVLFYRTSKASTLFGSGHSANKQELCREEKISEGYLGEQVGEELVSKCQRLV
jgi:hypothetical protein